MSETDSIKYIIDGKRTDFSWKVRMASDSFSSFAAYYMFIFFNI